MKNIGIGILDIYSQTHLNNLLDSIPEECRDNLFVSSNTNNLIPEKFKNFKFSKEVSLAAMRNRILAYFRQNPELKYYFLFNTNTIIDNIEFFQKTIKKAEVFGTWFMTGPGSDSILIEDEENKLELEVTAELNESFIFLIPNIIKHVGYFNEQFYSDNYLSLLDYTLRLREKNLYPVRPFNPTVQEFLKVENLGNRIYPNPHHRAEEKSLGLFFYLHKFIPGENEPPGATQEQLFKSIEKIQKTYAKS
jgi:hypothetical protein